MSRKIIVECQSGVREIALMDGKDLLYFHRDDPQPVQAEQIYLGKVDRMVKGVEAAFVQLNRELTGFLPYAECPAPPRSGDRVLVQVKKPPVGEKAAYLTQDISLAGRYAIYTPRTDRCAVSKRVDNPETKDRLLDIAHRLRPREGGLVMRLESAEAKEEDVAQEVAALTQKWARIREAARAAAPGLMEEQEDALSRLLRDEHGSIEEILTDDPAALPPLPLPIVQMDDPFSVYGVKSKLQKSMQRKVWLDCGGYLVIDPTEALTVIDVNSGKFTGKKSGAEDTFLLLNLQAAREIGRLLRLRNVGGIVIVDFVDMEREESRRAVQAEMEAALRLDPVKTVVHGFTSLGLLEMTRKKT